MPENNKAANYISPEKGSLLLELARKTIAERLDIVYSHSPDLDNCLRDEFFSQKRGTFVTLTIGGRLRGCIGNIAPDRSIADGVAGNASNAAFGDPRFAPLTPDEYKKIHIEVSLLSDPKPLLFTDGDDLLSKIRAGIDGLIIRKGIHGATFLPQVWDQLPDKRGFLGHLCQKAGLPADEWKKPGLKVHTYQVHYFKERN
ncbi:MAG: AmmeMemoRadiSam system protein A [Deltaproteobacteria bacterium]|nr:AmmeMemoRadiSam system protein A [Deltaproteobacteria bacterium]